jgi:hypothetical protein
MNGNFSGGIIWCFCNKAEDGGQPLQQKKAAALPVLPYLTVSVGE